MYSCSQTNQDINLSKQRACHAVLRLMCTGSTVDSYMTLATTIKIPTCASDVIEQVQLPSKNRHGVRTRSFGFGYN